MAFRWQTPGERPQSAAELLEGATREYRETGIARPVALGSVVAFPYGVIDPVLTCAALRACVIDLEPGERLVARPIAGDLVRWHVGIAPSGADSANTLVWVKPTDCDLSTNLLLSTDRRVYQLMLESPPCDRRSTNPRGSSITRATFYFPDSTIPGASWRAPVLTGEAGTSRQRGGLRFAALKPDSEAEQASAAVAGIVVDITRLNLEYRVKRDRRFPWAPSQVFDDGAHTFIRIPPEAAAHPAPALFEVHGDDMNTKKLLNYTVRDGFYVTDRTFRRAVLVLGRGKHERRVEIENPRFGVPAGTPAGGITGPAGGTGGREP